MKTIGEIIREKRIDMGWKQYQLAAMLGINQNTLSCYEQGRFFPNAIVLCDMADLFECTIDELCGRNV
jgi:transcriptional regulator with XRE-family HTH domain